MTTRTEPPGWSWMGEWLAAHPGAAYVDALVAWRQAGKPCPRERR